LLKNPFVTKYRKNDPRETLSNKKKSLVFGKSFSLYKEYFEKKDFLTSYFLINSILEDRINVMWVVRTWYDRCKDDNVRDWEDTRKPYGSEIEETSIFKKVKIIYESGDIDESLREKFIGKYNPDSNSYSGKGYFRDVRNKMIHNTIWLFDDIGLEKICCDVNRWVKLIESKRNKQKKELGR
jgi:hypothetical protein